MDYVQGPQMHPWTPGYSQDYRFNSTDNQNLVDNYITALSIRRQAHETRLLFQLAGMLHQWTTAEILVQ
ncbi:hypothetical protein [Clostridium sp. DJ247]|uniref:hypothetical protein n=1 Tax=Clostridium sp. DJ247 TaxID=2726188 RepID=UPI001F4C5400|nr:hypothetical protein [Clostridium sp. DJ247]